MGDREVKGMKFRYKKVEEEDRVRRVFLYLSRTRGREVRVN